MKYLNSFFYAMGLWNLMFGVYTESTYNIIIGIAIITLYKK